MFDMPTLGALLGGLGLFLLGMRMMTEGLKLAAGDALRALLQSWTHSPLRGLAAGFLITAIVQSSSAVTVATIGFVNAGLLTLSQAMWVVFGSNVGTTMTGWLVAMVGVKVDVGALSLPLLGTGMLLRLAAAGRVRLGGAGEALAGFGAFFLGVGFLQSAFSDLAPQFGLAGRPADPATLMLAVGLGAALTLLTQSSSAAVAITLTAVAQGAAPLLVAAAVVVGTNIGTTSTALLATLGATPPARRVAMAHIAFNLLTGAVALALLPVFVTISHEAAEFVGLGAEPPAVLAIFHTLFNLTGVAVIVPLARPLEQRLARLFATPAEQIGRPRHLDANLLAVPDLALRGLVIELSEMRALVFALLQRGLAAPLRPADEAVRSGLRLLAEAVRAFISGLSTRPLPAAVVDALPDLLRGLQHLEDLTELAGDLDGPDPQAPDLAASFGPLRAAAAGILQADEVATPDSAAMAGAEQAYQVFKAALLHATAEGRLTPEALDRLLARAARLRRCAEITVKTRRRLDGWIAGLGAVEGAEPYSAASAGLASASGTSAR
ncbi:MAG: Na/Pi cotransporter family protein [Phenylobacterium sp.]|uniref:Na/Pi cotransporter family protein n=1 Tax=Phenylobacterium sp. TaxID=1871053 RepID=UPI003919CB54